MYNKTRRVPSVRGDAPGTDQANRSAWWHGALICGGMLAAMVVSSAASAAPDTTVDRYTDYGDVIDVSPIIDRRFVTQTREICHQPVSHRYDNHGYGESRRYRRSHSGSEHNVGASIVGGLIGGAIGNQFGGGNGKKALTVVGALIGAGVANDVARDHRDHGDSYRRDRRYDHRSDYRRSYDRHDRHARAYRTSSRGVRSTCQIETTRVPVEKVVGYDVTYEFDGRTFHKRLDHDPGARIPIEVRVREQVEPAGYQRTSAGRAYAASWR